MPEIIGRYQIVRELGQGGMGLVYLAYDPHLERQVVVKKIIYLQAHRRQKILQRRTRHPIIPRRQIHPPQLYRPP